MDASVAVIDSDAGRFDAVVARATRAEALDRLRSGETTLESLAVESAFDRAVARLPLAAAVAAAHGISETRAAGLMARCRIRPDRRVGWLLSPLASRQAARLDRALSAEQLIDPGRQIAAGTWPFELVASP